MKIWKHQENNYLFMCWKVESPAVCCHGYCSIFKILVFPTAQTRSWLGWPTGLFHAANFLAAKALVTCREEELVLHLVCWMYPSGPSELQEPFWEAEILVRNTQVLPCSTDFWKTMSPEPILQLAGGLGTFNLCLDLCLCLIFLKTSFPALW